MKVRILGCSGGIGGRHLRTTSILVDNDILVDAGTGVGDLAMDELARIDHVFVTHSHLDHLACLPFVVDTVGDMRDRALTVHATAATLETIRAHIFNWVIWPDFTTIPSAEKPFLRFSPIQVGQTVEIDGRKITPLPAEHTVPAVGYRLDSGSASLVFTGDTGPCLDLWRAVNRIQNLRYLIVECAFSNREKTLALASQHLCPSLLREELKNLRRDAEIRPDIFVTHLKPGQIELTMQEIEDCIGEFRPGMLQNNQLFEL
jgi:ribonuclease BN (tRNA processing enzyme)